jgi:hypothetical protein
MTTKQDERRGGNFNPTGKGGFGDHPEHRSNGYWDSKNTFSFQLGRFKKMTIQQLEDWNKNTPKEVRTVAEDLAFIRIFKARENLKEFEVVADRTEGKAVQPVVNILPQHIQDLTDEEIEIRLAEIEKNETREVGTS